MSIMSFFTWWCASCAKWMAVGWWQQTVIYPICFGEFCCRNFATFHSATQVASCSWLILLSMQYTSRDLICKPKRSWICMGLSVGLFVCREINLLWNRQSRATIRQFEMNDFQLNSKKWIKTFQFTHNNTIDHCSSITAICEILPTRAPSSISL